MKNNVFFFLKAQYKTKYTEDFRKRYEYLSNSHGNSLLKLLGQQVTSYFDLTFIIELVLDPLIKMYQNLHFLRKYKRLDSSI